MDHVENIVLGAGVIGLAAARALARAGKEVVILERDTAIGNGVSSRSSEVIHAGLYYAPGSLKARFCVEGKHALYDYCRRHGVPHRRTGKLIVAANEAEAGALEDIAARAAQNGVDDLQLLSTDQAKTYEPALSCTAALFSPSTGIIDSHALMLSLQGEAEDRGMMIAFGAPFCSARPRNGGFVVEAGDSENPMSLTSDTLINAAGLGAWDVARAVEGLDPAEIPARHLSKGCYFALSGPAPFSRLIYPVPDRAGLGIHLTLDMGGQARFGPDAEWVEKIDYDVPAERRALFADSIRRYYPAIEKDRLHPAYAGIRPKIQAPGESPADFCISGPADHGVAGLVNLFGIESPGLTSCLAIAEHVRGLVD